MITSKAKKEEFLFKLGEIMAGTYGGPLGQTLFDLFVKDPNSQNPVDNSQKIIDAISNMEEDLKNEIKKDFDEQNTKTAKAEIRSWIDFGLHDYLIEKTNKKEKKTKTKLSADLEKKWDKGDIESNVIEILSEDVSVNLRIDGFATYWAANLFRIGYLQEQALLDEGVTNPNDSDWADDIPNTITKMGTNLTLVKADATTKRMGEIGKVDEASGTAHNVTQHNVEVQYRGLSKRTTMSSHTFANVPKTWYYFIDHQTGKQFTETAYRKMYLDRVIIHNTGHQDFEKASNTYLNGNAQSKTEKKHKDYCESVPDQIDNHYKPYQDTLEELQKLKDKPIPDSMAGFTTS